MNSYELKQQAKKERFEDLADRKEEESSKLWDEGTKALEAIPSGQPILVGHHSERGHRSYLKKNRNKLDKSIEIGKTADYYKNKAENIGKSGISSDDPDAVKKLKIKLAKLEDYQINMKEENAEAKALKNEKPHPTWQLSNNNAMIRNVKKRIERLTKENELVANEDIAGPGFVIHENKEENRIQFLFEEKPNEEIRAMLKSNGFRWSPRQSAWQRHLNDRGRYVSKLVLNKLK